MGRRVGTGDIQLAILKGYDLLPACKCGDCCASRAEMASDSDENSSELKPNGPECRRRSSTFFSKNRSTVDDADGPVLGHDVVHIVLVQLVKIWSKILFPFEVI